MSTASLEAEIAQQSDPTPSELAEWIQFSRQMEQDSNLVIRQ